MSYTDWKLTAEEEEECRHKGYSIGEPQEAKKRAYIKAGGVILNPDALPDLYEAVRWVLEDHRDKGIKLNVSTHTRLLNALTKAENK